MARCFRSPASHGTCSRKGAVRMTRQRPDDGTARARVITFANQKGGVAKSTTAEAFAASLTARGYAVLMRSEDTSELQSRI